MNEQAVPVMTPEELMGRMLEAPTWAEAKALGRAYFAAHPEECQSDFFRRVPARLLVKASKFLPDVLKELGNE